MSEQNNVLQLKKLAVKMTGKPFNDIEGLTIADVLDYIQQNYKSGGGTGGGETITSIELYADGNNGIHGGTITMSSGATINIEVKEIEQLTLTATNGSATAKTKITVSPTLGSGNHYRYLLNGELMPAKGEDLSDWTEWNGTDEISAQNGADLLVAECDTNNKAVKCGACNAVAPIF